MSFLFDKSPLPTSQYGHQIEAKTLARRDDPSTSHKAAAEVNLSESQRLFVAAIRGSNYPLTAAEAAAAAVPIDDIAKVQSVMAKRETIRKRAAELVRLGVVKVDDSRECKVTGNEAQTYRVV